MQSRVRPDLAWVAALLLLVLWAPGKVSVWLDSQGRPVLSDGEPPDDAEPIAPEELAARWRGQWIGEPLETPAVGDGFHQQLAEARDDLRRGEQGRALATLRRLAREFPARPEAHWALAQVELARGRHPAALESLESALSLAAAMPDGWRARAEALRARLHEELAHAGTLGSASETPFVQASQHFRLIYDHPFAGRGYGDGALVALERIRRSTQRTLGRTLAAPLDVKLYTRADYLRDYGHRFGFSTVGFYDGAIHVVAARHPERRLRALLAHEYVHAVFFDALGGHEPFFLNEGLAEREEGRVHGRERLARGDWRRLVDALRDDRWLPLSALVEAFNGLDPEQVPLAYLEARAAVEVLEARVPGVLVRWLASCAQGADWREALERFSGLDLVELDVALRDAVRGRFPELPESLGRSRLEIGPQASRSLQYSKSTRFDRM